MESDSNNVTEQLSLVDPTEAEKETEKAERHQENGNVKLPFKKESDNNNLSETEVVTEQKAEKPENGRVMNAPPSVVKIPSLERFVAVDWGRYKVII